MSLNIKIEFHIHLKENKKNTHTDVEPLMSKAFCTLAEQHIESLRNQRTPSTIENYLTALSSFHSFLVHTKTIVPLNADIFEKYEHYLRDSNLKPNTTSCYMRSLRSLAIRILGDEARKMFCKVYTGRAITEKRSLPVEDFASLRSLTLKPGSSLALTRDLFLFSFYAMGMPFVDMAFLRRDQISNGRMTYYA